MYSKNEINKAERHDEIIIRFRNFYFPHVQIKTEFSQWRGSNRDGLYRLLLVFTQRLQLVCPWLLNNHRPRGSLCEHYTQSFFLSIKRFYTDYLIK